MAIKKYINEIKYRLFFISISWLLNICLSYYYIETIIFITIKPGLVLYTNDNLYFVYTHLNEIFNSYLSLIFMCANNITLLIIMYHLFMFFKPSMYIKEYNEVKKLFILFNVLWVSNIITLYYIILPFSWKFFLSYQSTSILEKSTSFFFEAKIQEYIYFIYELYYICFIFNVFFYFIIFFIQKFSFNKKYIYLIIFIFSTVITPPDVISQLMLSCVLIVIIEIYLYYNIFLNNLRKPIKTY